MTKSQVAAHMAERWAISKKQAAQGMEEFVKLAYRERRLVHDSRPRQA